MRITDSQSLFQVVFMALMTKLATTRPMARKLQARTMRSHAVCFRGELNGFVRDLPTWGEGPDLIDNAIKAIYGASDQALESHYQNTMNIDASTTTFL